MRFFSLLSLAFALLISACGLGVDAIDIAATVDVSPPLDTVVISDTARYRIELRTEDGELLTGRPVRWESLGPAVATVDTAGLVTGNLPGRTSIVATVDGQKGVAQVHVLSRQFPAFAVGDLHTCGATDSGEVHCWGLNSFGQLGFSGGSIDCGGIPCERRVTPVAPGLDAVAVGAGGEHSCAIATDGATYCWGSNDEGQLGNGAFSAAATPEPQRVLGTARFETVDGGLDFTCGLTADGATFCWGEGLWGQLGNGGTGASNVPVQVQLPEPLVAISLGERHACGISEDGDGYCWGRNVNGQLGSGSSADRSTVPVPVAGGLKLKAISAGRTHTCAVALDGMAWCWGAGALGQLGYDGASQTPRRIDSSIRFAKIAAGVHHTCAVAENSRIFCWGDNRYSQLGNGSASPAPSTTPVQAAATAAFTKVYAGELHSCGTTAKASVYCWGYAGAHQLGRPGEQPCPAEPGLFCAARPQTVIGSLRE